jgi:hypothetical protein
VGLGFFCATAAWWGGLGGVGGFGPEEEAAVFPRFGGGEPMEMEEVHGDGWVARGFLLAWVNRRNGQKYNGLSGKIKQNGGDGVYEQVVICFFF